jgi:threonine synthase
VTFRDALFDGLAPDGGLYLPERIEPIAASTVAALRGTPLTTVAGAVAAHLVENEIPRTVLEQIVASALDFPMPLVDVGNAQALELFHGPTFAFKDVGARTMARLMAHFVAPGDHLTVLVATSGDTGSAVAQAFAGLPGTRVIVLFPEGQVSAVQEAQFTTLGGNVKAVAVQGTFDDCQALVKAAFADEDVRRRVRLTSANSINVGRLLPQIFYYAWASLAWPARTELVVRPEHLPDSPGRPARRQVESAPIFSVPSGNFGNLTAGLIAKRLGFPVDHFVAATNVNDVVPEYLASGRYAPRQSVRTVANAMDVGAPSNFERIRALYADDVEKVRNDVRGAAFDDQRVKGAIGEVYERHGHVLDPHSAIAWLGLGGQPGIFLSTAHPAKFREVVEPVIRRRIDLPPALRAALDRDRHVLSIPARYEDLRDKIL